MKSISSTAIVACCLLPAFGFVAAEAFVPPALLSKTASSSSASTSTSTSVPNNNCQRLNIVSVVLEASKAAGNSSSSNKKKNKKSTRDNHRQGKEVMEDLFYREADAIFDMIDANDDGEISNAELRGHLESKGYPSDSIRKLFTAMDKNADGAISRDEMRYAFSNYEISALYRAFGLGNEMVSLTNPNPTKGFDDAVSKIRKRAVDERTPPEMLTKLADTIFDMIDVDGSGEIDVLELRMHFADPDQTSTTTCFRQVGAESSVASVDSILKALDINSDGVISRDEMRQGFREYDPKALSSALGLQVSRTAET